MMWTRRVAGRCYRAADERQSKARALLRRVTSIRSRNGTRAPWDDPNALPAFPLLSLPGSVPDLPVCPCPAVAWPPGPANRPSLLDGALHALVRAGARAAVLGLALDDEPL